ncbi:MAG: VWA domain-containing protein [bacterium]|nr:VWA domain-containing protein [bacterium]
MTTRIKLSLLLPVVLLLGAGPILGQEQAGEEAATDDFFFETVDVNVVNVEVYVTDRKGEPITGLTRNDFEILEDKRPMEITNFYVTEEGRPIIPTRVELPETAAEIPGIERSAMSLIPESQRLYVAVYIDNFNIRPFNRNRVFRDLRQFLSDELTEQDQVMLVSYDRSLKVRHAFTNDAGVISRALFELENLTGHALARDSERRELLQEIDQADELVEVEYRVRQYAEELYNNASFTLSALKEYIGSLAGLEGRKALIYVSDGLEMIQGEDLFNALQRKFLHSSGLSGMMDFNTQREFQRVTQLANSNRVALYTVDAAGLRVSSSVSADSKGLQTPGLGSFVDSIYISNLQSPLIYMAEQTGGQAIINSNRVGPGLAKIGRDFDTYYSLGYAPSHTGDGKYHKITVRLKDQRKGIKLRHREGYRDKDLRGRMADKTTSTLMYGFESNPMAVALHVGKENLREGGNYVVPVAVMVPIGELELVPRERFHQGRVKLFFSAMDDEGRMSDLQEIPLDIQIPTDEVEIAVEKPYVYTVSLEMRGGSHRLAVGVRDEIGATESFVSRTVYVGAG